MIQADHGRIYKKNPRGGIPVFSGRRFPVFPWKKGRSGKPEHSESAQGCADCRQEL